MREWTASEWEPASGDRVLRGGAFSYEAGLVRCACRLRYAPRLRYYNVGFRVVAVLVHC